MDVVEAKDIVRVEIDRPTPTVLEVSHSIDAHPELNFEKHPAHDTLTGVLEEQGLAVERSAYDAPPGIGQAAGTTSSAPPVLVPNWPLPRSPGRLAPVSGSPARPPKRAAEAKSS